MEPRSPLEPPQSSTTFDNSSAAAAIWQKLDFRNLSVEVLSQIWATTLIDAGIKKKLGIHRTPRTVVKYIVKSIPFAHGDDRRTVLEPCSGSGVFLIGAMNHLRHQLFGMSRSQRHAYFSKHLSAIEKDPFGVEISRFALTLADFPNPDGWNINNGDVFNPEVLAPQVSRAGVVLCNPPFETFDHDERADYLLDSNHVQQLFAKHAGVLAKAAIVPNAQLRTSVISLGEIEAGHRMTTSNDPVRRNEYVTWVNQKFLPHVCNITAATREPYGEILGRIWAHHGPKKSKKTEPYLVVTLGIDINDVWIAALALEHGLTLVTHDGMEKIRSAVLKIGLQIEDWMVRGSPSVSPLPP